MIQNIIKGIKRLLFYTPPKEFKEIIKEKENYNVQYDARKEIKPKKEIKVSANINENLQTIKEMFSVPKNDDVVIRMFSIKGDIKCFVLFYDGMTNNEFIDDYIIKGLMELPYIENGEIKALSRNILEKFIIHSQVVSTESIDKIAEDVNFGGCGLFIDGLNQGFSFDVRFWEHRGITKPENEQSVYGPQEAFGEMMRTNTALIRKYLKTEKLIAEGIKVGNISKNRGVLLYIDDIANKELVDEVRKRLNSISVDFIFSAEEVAQFIEDSHTGLFAQTMTTERPDRAARALADGRIVFLMNSSPRVLVLPTNFYELTHSASDAYIRAPYANMTRIIRIIGMTVSMLLPALYLAITLFHQEMLPTYLLYAISASRTNVPFPSVLELLLMDISFELIREAGLRMPGPVGQTLGIVGGLILGQSAVSAKIVSPIMIVIIALTGIGSFSTSDYSLSWTFRVLRLIFIILAATSGFLGIGIGIFACLCLLCASNNFGIDYLSPFPGEDNESFIGSVFIKKIWKREKRPAYLHTDKEEKEPPISRGWRIKS